MHTERLKITDMSCGGCSTKVAQALKAATGRRSRRSPRNTCGITASMG